METLRKFFELRKWRVRYGRRLKQQFQKGNFRVHKLLTVNLRILQRFVL